MSKNLFPQPLSCKRSFMRNKFAFAVCEAFSKEGSVRPSDYSVSFDRRAAESDYGLAPGELDGLSPLEAEAFLGLDPGELGAYVDVEGE